MNIKLLSLLYLSILKCVSSNGKFYITINSDKKIKPMRFLWRSTGFSPEIPKTHIKKPNLLLNKDILLNLAFIGSLPKGPSINNVCNFIWGLKYLKGT